MKRLLFILCMQLSLLMTASTIWYIPGWMRCHAPNSEAMAAMRQTFANATVVYRDWDGNCLWGTSLAHADAFAVALAQEILRLPEAEREKLILVGHSLGGRITVRVLAELARHGRKIRQGILMAAAIPYRDADIRQMSDASELMILNLCNPEDITLKYIYAVVGAESAPALGANGSPTALKNYQEYVIPADFSKHVHFNSRLRNLAAVKPVVNHHAVNYITFLQKLLNGEAPAAEDTVMVPQGKLNLRVKVTDGKVWWTVCDTCRGWELQQNLVTGHCRIINPDKERTAWGSPTDMREAFSKLRLQLEQP